ncbi:hypothetical protein POM88_052796 [Heracleum sosnowskyi]|uniref:F-box associated beta-propeller type 1 domain-containing protein n=1 Tax=Heracleum sosnowskyi TaxID=360622 RepID=A0AAD8GQZ9_9APIA|nr:hypothetical protein POM88_052796 [Heracleum sosnowskyi]
MYNPITGQHIVVQQPKRDDLEWHCCALMYAQKSNRLKLLGFYRKSRGQLAADIQTIGTNTWRSIGEVPCHHYGYELPILLNGHCHWLDYKKAVINSFDAEEEVFQVIQTPLSFKNYAWHNLGSLNGCLCLSLSSFASVCDFDVWVMNKYGIEDSWTKKFVISGIQNLSAGALLEPLTCLKSGEILMLVCSTDIVFIRDEIPSKKAGIDACIFILILVYKVLLPSAANASSLVAPLAVTIFKLQLSND